MKYFIFILSCLSLWAETAINEALFSLKQINSLMPERLWMQEFSILVDQSGFAENAKRVLLQNEKREKTIRPSFCIAESKEYFLFATMSGDPIRIIDRYEEFEQGAFWDNPDDVEQLEWLECEDECE